MKQKFWDITHELQQTSTPFVVITLVSARGHAPQDPGAKAIILEHGLYWGTVGGGKVEARAITYAQELLQKKSTTPELLHWNLQRDIGMTCGGEATFLFETHNTSHWQIVIFGAGHIAQALTRTLATLECNITCIDSRADWIERLPTKTKRICIPDPATYVKECTKNTFFITMTQGHATDIPVLEEIFHHYPDAPYIGVIGSETKAAKIRSELKSHGASPTNLEKLRCPIGLPIGKNNPAEIAISIVAELLQVRDRLQNANV